MQHRRALHRTTSIPSRLWTFLGAVSHRWMLLAILFVASVARLYGIVTESLWLDEATSLMLARMDVPTLVEWTALDIHPPLYYTLLHYWLTFGQSELAIRSLSALAGVLNIAVIYGLGATLFDRRTGLLSAVLLALAPFHVWYSQEARMYAWVALLISASILLSLHAWRHRRWPVWVAYVLVTAAALYTHYYAVFGILLANLFFAYLFSRGRLNGRMIAVWALSQVAVLLLFLPWLPTFLLPITVGGGGWITMGMGRPSVAVLAQTAVLYMAGFGRELYPVLLRRAGYLLFLALFAVGLWAWRRDANGSDEVGRADGYSPSPGDATLFLLAYLVVPLGIAWGASQVFKPMYSARYMLPFLIPFLLLVARGLSAIPWPAARGVALVGILVVSLFGIQAQVRMMDKPDWRGWARRLAEQSESGDVVLFMPGWHAKPFAYYSHDALDLYGDVPIPVPRYGERALAAVEEAIAGHPRVWFVWEVGHYADPQGAVYEYLDSHCRQVSQAPIELIGSVTLFENRSATGAAP